VSGTRTIRFGCGCLSSITHEKSGTPIIATFPPPNKANRPFTPSFSNTFSAGRCNAASALARIASSFSANAVSVKPGPISIGVENKLARAVANWTTWQMSSGKEIQGVRVSRLVLGCVRRIVAVLWVLKGRSSIVPSFIRGRFGRLVRIVRCFKVGRKCDVTSLLSFDHNFQTSIAGRADDPGK